MSLTADRLGESPWWPIFVARLAAEPMAKVCRELKIREDDACRLLAAWQGPADQSPWWPEAVRRLSEGVSIRAVARSFATEPRRIRRGLARAGLRVAGAPAGPDGFEALAPVRDRLGTEADGVLAREAKVIPEAVQGERRRLGVEPFRQQRAMPRLTEAEEAWVRGPVKGKRERHRVDPDALTVVRRPARTETSPPVLRTRAVIPGEARAPEPFVERRRAAAPIEPAEPGGPWRGPERRSRDFFWDDRRSEIDALLQAPRREREGRQRIVRSDAAREPTPVEVERRRLPRGDAPAWRTVPAAAAERVTEAATPPPALPRPPAALPRPPAALPRPPVAPPVVTPPRAASSPKPAPAAVPAAPSQPLARWELLLSGEETGLVVEAPDVAAAAAMISARLPAFLRAEAGIHRIDGG